MKPAFVLLFISLLSSSCNTDEQEQPKKTEGSLNKLDTSIQKLDGSIGGLLKTVAFLDSNLKYAHLAKETEVNMYKAKSDYYRTEDEKYRQLFYKLQDKHNYYVGLNRKYYDSLQAQSKN